MTIKTYQLWPLKHINFDGNTTIYISTFALLKRGNTLVETHRWSLKLHFTTNIYVWLNALIEWKKKHITEYYIILPPNHQCFIDTFPKSFTLWRLYSTLYYLYGLRAALIHFLDHLHYDVGTAHYLYGLRAALIPFPKHTLISIGWVTILFKIWVCSELI